jgi:hypothetical protein
MIRYVPVGNPLVLLTFRRRYAAVLATRSHGFRALTSNTMDPRAIIVVNLHRAADLSGTLKAMRL